MPGLHARGPDYLGSVEVHIPAAARMLLAASLLQLRGSQPMSSPLMHCSSATERVSAGISEGGSSSLAASASANLSGAVTGAGGCSSNSEGSTAAHLCAAKPSGAGPTAASPAADDVLCFNGEIFGGVHVPAGYNDGQVLLAQLAASEPGNIPKVLSTLRGPWALLYWRQQDLTLWFGRDIMGRRSLLVHCPSDSDPRFILSSVAPLTATIRVPVPTLSLPADSPLQLTPVAPMPSSSQGAEGDEGEGSTPPQTDAYWRDLAPGLYSLRLSEHGSDGASGGGNGACCNSAAGLCRADEVDRADSQCRPPPLLPARLEAHSWQDLQLQDLSDYRRPACLVSPAGGTMTSAGGTVTNSTAEAAALQRPSSAVQHTGDTARPHNATLGTALAAAAPNIATTTAGACSVSPSTATFRCPGSRSTTCDGSACATVHGWTAPPCSVVAPDTAAQEVACFPGPQTVEQLAMELLAVLTAAVEVRCRCIEGQTPCSSSTAAGPLDGRISTAGNMAGGCVPGAPVLLLFSGGADSMLLAALLHRCLPPGLPIDLSNVCFGGGMSADRLAARAGLEELARYAPSRQWRLIEVDSTLEAMELHRPRIMSLLQPSGTFMDLNIGMALWLATSASGTLRLPAAAAAREADHPRNGAVGALADATTGAAGGMVLRSHADLIALPGALPHHAADAVARHALLPKGRYTSTARVVFLGHGADEQCAGYGRHRTRFRKHGWEGLQEELRLDVRRMWLRNLGRDDRLVADWGREARHPFLDECVMALLLGAPLPAVTDMTLPPGVGDKAALRCALVLMGLPEAAARVKRAIQFGSRIGRAANIKYFGTNQAAQKVHAGKVAVATRGC